MSDEGAEKFGGTKEVEENHAFDVKRLEAYMHAHVEGFQGPLDVRQFKGGQSNPTYQLITPTKKYVMRRKPPGKLLPSAHAVDREYRIITALGKVDYPVAKTYCLCTDDDVIGKTRIIRRCKHIAVTHLHLVAACISGIFDISSQRQVSGIVCTCNGGIGWR